MPGILLIIISQVVLAQSPLAKAEAQNFAAVRLVREGRYAEAEGLFRAALSGHYDDDLTRAKIAHNLGSLDEWQDRYLDAEIMYRSALQWHRKNLPAGSVEIAYSLNNLANIYRIEGRNREAQNLLETAVQSLEQLHPDAPGLPRILSNLALVHFSFGELAAAEELLRRAIISYQPRETSSLDYGVALVNLAQVLQARNDLDAAAPLYAQAISIFDNLGTQAQPFLAAALAPNGTLYQRQGRMEEARQVEQRALALLRPTGDEVLRASILQNLGIIAASAGHAADSLHYYEESLAIHKRIFGTDCPATASLLLDYASAATRAGNKSLSRKLRSRAKELLARSHPTSLEGLTVSLNALRETK